MFQYRQIQIVYSSQLQQNMNIKQLDSDRQESLQQDSKRQNKIKKQIKNDPSLQQPLANKLVYPPGANNLKIQKEQTQPVKAQLKSQINAIKYEIRNRKAKKRGLFYSGPNQKKKEIEKLAFPPPQKQMPLRNIKLEKGGEKKVQEIMDQKNNEAKQLIYKMKLVYKKDLDNFLKGQLAYHKVRHLKTLSQKLNDVYIKRQFIELKGLKQFQKWLQRIINEEKVEFQPSLALKLGLTKILRDMNLTADQLETTKYLKSHISRNRQSQVQELRQLSTDLISQWQYAAIQQIGR